MTTTRSRSAMVTLCACLLALTACDADDSVGHGVSLDENASALALHGAIWTPWFDRDDPSGAGDYETLADLAPTGCLQALDIECFTLDGVDPRFTGDVYTCDPAIGGVCINGDQPDGACHDYQVRFLCETRSVEAPTFQGHWGRWHPIAWCPDGTFASGFKARVEGSRGGRRDDTGLNSVQLECKGSDGSDAGWIESYPGIWGSWRGARSCPGAGNFLTSLVVRWEGQQGGGDDTAMNGLRGTCIDGSQPEEAGPFGDWQDNSPLSCPAGTAICGLSIQFEDDQGSGDDTAMNGLRVECCPL
jgi:hypothetical protein